LIPKARGLPRPEIFTIDVRGNVLKNIRIVAPSLVAKNKRFDVIIRFEDVFGNLTNNAAEGTLVEVPMNIYAKISTEAFRSGTGFINVPNLYFNEPVSTRFSCATSNRGCLLLFTIKCFPESRQKHLLGASSWRI